MAGDLVFLDIETLGIPLGAPIWEFAAYRTDRAGNVLEREHMYVRHDAGRAERWIADLPDEFVADYQARYDPERATPRYLAAIRIANICRPRNGQPCKVAGSNPNFDMQHLELLLTSEGWTPGWHYHPLDIPSMALGYLAARGRLEEAADWRSNSLSLALGIPLRARHTAEGDVAWCLAQYLEMLGRLEPDVALGLGYE